MIRREKHAASSSSPRRLDLDIASGDSLSYAGMSKKKIAYIGLALILLGVLSLIYGGVGYSLQERLMELRSFEADMEMPGKVQVRLWGSAVLLACGAVLVVVGLRQR